MGFRTNHSYNKSGITVKNTKNKIALVGDKFTTEDLKKEMDKRKVFGEYSDGSVRKVIHKAVKCNLIKKIHKGVSSKGEKDIFQKIL